MTETLLLHYPSAVPQKNEYIQDNIRLEFGGRNQTTPCQGMTITTDISEYIQNLSFPVAQANVLSPLKTYWEKITLIHYECNRPDIKEDANRISRHWYDIYMLSHHEIGKQALENISMLHDVVKIKKTFYDSSFAKYDNCLTGNVKLTPTDSKLEQLSDDFNKMIQNKMFYSNPPSFQELISTIMLLEKKLNEKLKSNPVSC